MSILCLKKLDIFTVYTYNNKNHISYLMVSEEKQMSDLGNKEVMAENILHYMNLRDKTRREICGDLDIKYTTFADWINAVTYPRIDKIELMANYFGIAKSDLIEKRAAAASGGTFRVSSPKRKAIMVPVLGSVAAGIPIEALEEVIDYEEIDENMARQGDIVGLRIKGDSMAPRILDGDVVIVRIQNYIEDGEIAIAIVNGDEATCKKIKKTPRGVYLISINPAYEPYFFNNEEIESLPVAIWGKVIELRGKF